MLGAKVLLVCFVQLFANCIVAQPPPYHLCGDKRRPDSNGSVSQTVLDVVLASLSSYASNNTFHNQTLNQIYSLFLCRGDAIDQNSCYSCVTTASQEIRGKCASNATAIIWYDNCMLRYSSRNFFGEEEVSPKVFGCNQEDRPMAPDEPDPDAFGLIDPMVASAPYTEMMYKADTKQAKDGSYRFGLVQCTRDISSHVCSKCLRNITTQILPRCQRKMGWRYLAPSCSVRYEFYPFFISSAPLPNHNNGPGKGGGNKSKIILIVVLPVVAVTMAALLGFSIYRRFCCKNNEQRETTGASLLRNLESSKDGDMELGNQKDSKEMQYFDLATISDATNNFSDGNKLGEGGFGPVYKGNLPDGKEIAVKRLLRNSGQGLEEFKTEVLLIVKLQHKNLVRLFGCCIEKGEKLLVYEYLVNTSLDKFLFDETRCLKLDWATRSNIIKGIARGLQYLHEDSRLKVIHRDLKTSNILLDDNMEAKISDFGTARIFGGNQVEASTNRVIGTYGYMAPEYAMEGLFSVKSDVYSFGVILLEILCRKKIGAFHQPEHCESLLNYAWRLWNEGKGPELIDHDLVNTSPTNVVLGWIHIALLCVQENPQDRPNMSFVVMMLGSETLNLPKPSQPPFSVGRLTTRDQFPSQSMSKSQPSSVNEVTMSDFYAR